MTDYNNAIVGHSLYVGFECLNLAWPYTPVQVISAARSPLLSAVDRCVVQVPVIGASRLLVGLQRPSFVVALRLGRCVYVSSRVGGRSVCERLFDCLCASTSRSVCVSVGASIWQS